MSRRIFADGFNLRSDAVEEESLIDVFLRVRIDIHGIACRFNLPNPPQEFMHIVQVPVFEWGDNLGDGIRYLFG